MVAGTHATTKVRTGSRVGQTEPRHDVRGIRTQQNSGGCRVPVDPEGHPGQADDQVTRDVRLQHVHAHCAAQVYVDAQVGEFTCKNTK